MSFRFVRNVVSALAVLASGACVYGFSGGGGLPEHIDRVSVPPIQNETVRLVLTEQVTQGLLDAVRGRLGAQVAAEQTADAVIRIRLTRFDRETVSFEGRRGAGAQVFQRRVSISAAVEIEDRARDAMLFEGTVRGTGEYAPDEESEDVAVDLAIEDLIQKIVNGAQSQW